MICKKCGAKNNDKRIKCFHCGYVFEKGVESDSLFTDYPNDIIEKKPAGQKADFGAQDDVLKRNNHNSYDNEIVIENEFEDEIQPYDLDLDVFPTKKHSFVKESKQPEQISSLDEDYDYDEFNNADTYEDEQYYDDTNEDELNEYDDYYDNSISSKKKSRKVPDDILELSVDADTEQHFKVANRKRNLGYNALIWVLVLAFIIVSIFVGTLIFTLISSDDTPVAPDSNSSTEIGIAPPSIQHLTDENGVEYIHAVFTGRIGDRIHLKCNNTYHTFIEETLELKLYLEDLFDSGYEFKTSTVNANMNAYYIRDNKSYSCNAPSFTISVPEAEMELISPLEQNIKVYRDKYTIKLWTTTDSTVSLNNSNITSSMDGLGNISYDVDVEANSSTTYLLVVSQPYHTPKSQIFILTRDALPVNLTIATSNAAVIHENKITISGSTEEGATISSNLPTIGEIEKNELYNTFTATIDLSGCKYGQIEVKISAENEKGVSTKSHIFWYWPEENSVTTTAAKFNSAVASKPESYRGKTFLLNSVTVKKNISANKFEATCSLNGIDYPLIITNEFSSTNVLVNSKYKIFAECVGVLEDGKPLFRAWYIYTAK